MIAVFVANIPEAEDRFSVKKRNRTAMPYHICGVNKEEHAGFLTRLNGAG